MAQQAPVVIGNTKTGNGGLHVAPPAARQEAVTSTVASSSQRPSPGHAGVASPSGAPQRASHTDPPIKANSKPRSMWDELNKEEKKYLCDYYRALPGGGHAVAQRILLQAGDYKDVWAHEWGITLAQCRELMHHVRDDTEKPWNVEYTIADLVELYIKRWTAERGVSYAVLVNGDRPREANVMVSHAWAERAEDFFDSLARSVSEDDVMFISALSIYQCEDGCGPTISQQLGRDAKDSPLWRVLDNIRHHNETAGFGWRQQHYLKLLSMLFLIASWISFCIPIVAEACAPTFDQCARRASPTSESYLQFEYVDLHENYRFCLPFALIFLGLASLGLIVLRLKDVYPGRMVVVPSRQCEIYSRLWCIYETYLAVRMKVPVAMAFTIASTGSYHCSVQGGLCSSPADQERIQQEMLSMAEQGFQSVTSTIRRIALTSRLDATFELLFFTIAFGISLSCFLCLLVHDTSTHQTRLGLSIGIGAGEFFLLHSQSQIIARAQGQVHCLRLWTDPPTIALAAGGFYMLIITAALLPVVATSGTTTLTLLSLMGALNIATISGYLLAPLFVGLYLSSIGDMLHGWLERDIVLLPICVIEVLCVAAALSQMASSEQYYPVAILVSLPVSWLCILVYIWRLLMRWGIQVGVDMPIDNEKTL